MTNRFWSKVDRRGEDECWEWRRYRVRGYGQFKIDGRWRRAHRVAWELTRSAIPAGLNVCHHCDNPTCCNPGHLFLGTHADNRADAVAKGRAATGERHGSAKIRDAQIPYIRAMCSAGLSQRDVARAYGIGDAQISQIMRGTSRARA